MLHPPRLLDTSLVSSERPAAWSAFVIAVLFVSGCGTAGSPTSPSPAAAASPAMVSSTPTTAPPVATAPVTAAVLEMMSSALQDEYHAQAVYQGVLDDLGPVFPFTNVVRAEQSHAASVTQLFTGRGVTPPVSAWSVANVPHFQSLAQACSAAAEAEVANIALYDRYLAADLPLDVRNVFSNNRAASVNGHLPAFTRCR